MFQPNSDRLITAMESRAPSEMEGRWFVFQVATHFEQRVADFLCAVGINHYLPLILNKRPKKLRPLYPGYIFVACTDFEQEYVTRRHANVWGRLEVKDQKLLIKKLDALRDDIATGKIADTFDKDLIGKTCYIKGGPWRGRESTVEGPGKRDTVVCNITTLGRPLPVEIEIRHLELVP